jgi:hypothetical protein
LDDKNSPIPFPGKGFLGIAAPFKRAAEQFAEAFF